MARLYRVSADTAEKEKIIGGLFTLAQGGWFAAGFLVAGLVFFVISRLTRSAVLALLLALPLGAAIVYFFAFYKIMELPLLTYLLYSRDMRKKTKTLVNDLQYGQNKKTEFFK